MNNLPNKREKNLGCALPVLGGAVIFGSIEYANQSAQHVEHVLTAWGVGYGIVVLGMLYFGWKFKDQ